MTDFLPASQGPGYDESCYELADGPAQKVLRKRDTRTDAEKKRARFWAKRREELGDDRAGLGVFGDQWRMWHSCLMELINEETGELTHVRLMHFDPDEGVANLAVVAVMASGSTTGIGLLAKHPWPPPGVRVRVLKDGPRG